MLQTLDVLIGFAVVMLILSVIVTTLVQFTVTTLLNLKGHVLKDGVARLLLLLDKNVLSAGEATEIADHILRNQLIGRKRIYSQGRQLASVVHREELTKLILDFAVPADLTKASATAQGRFINGKREEYLRGKLLESLKKNGIVDPPDEILRAVRATMLALERNEPELASDVRQTVALLTHASGEYLAKINAWFDQTIDRTVETFTARTRIWTMIFSLAVALFFQVNSFELIKRLSVDQPTRQMLVDMAIKEPQRFEMLARAEAETETRNPALTKAEAQAQARNALKNPSLAADGDRPAGAPATVGSSAAPTISPVVALERIRNDENLGQLVEADLIAWPRDGRAWVRYWTSPPDTYGFLVRLIGVLLTVGMLGLGAPVWYEVLKNLIQLRSVVAGKDDAQRTLRQTTQTSGDAGGPGGRSTTLAAAPAGERGDLTAVG